MASHSESVALLIDAKAHSEWSSYWIDSDLLTPADAWEVRLSHGAGGPLSVQCGSRVQVKVGRDTVLIGHVDQVRRRTSKDEKTLTISGRDLVGVLRDASAPVFTARQVGLAEVVANVVKPLGITKIRISRAQPHAAWDRISIEPGDSAWDALVRAASAEGLSPWFDPDGTLVVDVPDYRSPPVATLVLRKNGEGNNVEWFDEDMSFAERFSEVTVLGQSHGTASALGQHAIKVTVKDKTVTTYRPKVVVDYDAPNLAAAEARARKIISDSALAGHTLRAGVQGHRTPDGLLWKPGQRVNVVWEEHGLDAVFFLIARRLSGGRRGGTRTTLTLKDDGVWIAGNASHGSRRHRHKRSGPSLEVTDAVIDASIMR
ncbi:phage baseplate assembly protein [Caballeronia sp. LZ001]|uniref:phage baseplate assembly protein n=1 Tax=Caballeronia sp. LZ001 TaxID=3038553 RepID=UPI00285CEF58|nr:phage tail protein [Caballeronia sp. LZ001]MDR5803398.1 phage tail protein [Caballeronia sp. LZ001]